MTTYCGIDDRNRRLGKRAAWMLPVLLGSFCFLVIVGYRILMPGNIAWLSEGDPAIHYLGSQYFLNSPWTLPLGANPNYGLDIAGSIVYSDSIPLVALLLKPFAAWLPQPFQYFGIWIYACFVLQAIFGFQLAGLATRDPVTRLLAAALFVVAPPMIWRLHGHLALMGHFVILAALYLNLGPKGLRRNCWWPLLLAGTTLIHFYLLVAVAALWGADLWRRWLEEEAQYRPIILEAGSATALVMFCAWQAGYFLTSGLATDEFGIYRMNLLSPIDPSGWSYLLADLPESGGNYEGFAYLGLGSMLTFLFAAYALLTPSEHTARPRRWFPLLCILGALIAFAASHRISIASLEFTIPIPTAIAEKASILRASGRMVWPAYYAALFFALWLLSTRLPRRHVAAILTVAACVQLGDTSAGWRTISRLKATPSASWESPLKSDFWEVAGKQYKKVRVVPFCFCGGDWRFFANYAATHHMATDSVQLARIDAKKLETMNAEETARLMAGNCEADTLYILSDDLAKAAHPSIDAQRDLLTQVDGRYVLAPGWVTRVKVCAVAQSCPIRFP